MCERQRWSQGLVFCSPTRVGKQESGEGGRGSKYLQRVSFVCCTLPQVQHVLWGGHKPSSTASTWNPESKLGNQIQNLGNEALAEIQIAIESPSTALISSFLQGKSTARAKCLALLVLTWIPWSLLPHQLSAHQARRKLACLGLQICSQIYIISFYSPCFLSCATSRWRSHLREDLPAKGHEL